MSGGKYRLFQNALARSRMHRGPLISRRSDAQESWPSHAKDDAAIVAQRMRIATVRKSTVPT
jgi:hypothetical protein